MNPTTVPASKPYRFVEDDNKHAIYSDPRISAAQLAEFSVADHSRQETIMRNAKRSKISVVGQYNHLKHGLRTSITTDGLDPVRLREVAASVRTKAQNFEQEVRDGKTWNRNVCLRNADALERIAEISDLIPCNFTSIIPKPKREGFDHLMISGVRVSIQPIVIFTTLHRKKTYVGAIMLHTGKNENLALSKGPEGAKMGDYLGALVYRLLESHMEQWGQPSRSHCSIIDVYRAEVYRPPQNHKTLFKNMDAACRSIHAQWESLPGIAPVGDLAVDEDEF